MPRQAADHRVPRRDVSLRHPIEQVPGRRDGAVLGVHVQQRRAEDDAHGDTLLLHVRVDPLPCGQPACPGARRQHGGEGGVARLEARRHHLLKEQQGLVGAGVLRVSADHRRPDDEIPLGRFVEQLPRLRQQPAGPIGADQVVDDVYVCVQPALLRLGMDLPAGGKGVAVDAALEQEGEGVPAGGDPHGLHLHVEIDGVGRRGAVGEGADEGVPHEGVGFSRLLEEGQRVTHVAGRGEGGEGDETAGSVVVVDAGADYHLRVDLLQLPHGGAAVGEEGERWAPPGPRGRRENIGAAVLEEI